MAILDFADEGLWPALAFRHAKLRNTSCDTATELTTNFIPIVVPNCHQLCHLGRR